MLVQEKNNKGFTVLELMIVLALVGLLSAVAYPNFSEWNHSRKVSNDVDRINSLIRNTHIQTERGSLAYVQILFESTDDGLVVEGKGLTMTSLADKINDGDNEWNTVSSSRCDTEDGSYWDTDKTDTVQVIKDSVYKITLTNVSTNLTDTGAICFSRNGKFYEGSGPLEDGPVNSIILCSVKRSTNCEIPVLISDQKELYLHKIKWSRYGNIYKVKWLARNEASGWSDE